MFKLVHLKTPPTSAGIWWSLKQAGTTHPAGMFSFFWSFLFSRSKKSQIPCFTKWWNTNSIWKGKNTRSKTYRKVTTQCNGQSAARFLVFISIKRISFHSILRIFFIRSTETGTRKRHNVFQFPTWKLKCMNIKLQCGNISALHSWWWKTASKSQCETDTDSILLTLLFPFNREVHRVAGDISMKVVTGGGVELTLTSSLVPNSTVLSANFQTNWLTLTFVFLCGELVRGKDGDGHCCLGFISMTDCSNDSLFKWQCKTWHCPPLPGARWR